MNEQLERPILKAQNRLLIRTNEIAKAQVILDISYDFVSALPRHKLGVIAGDGALLIALDAIGYHHTHGDKERDVRDALHFHYRELYNSRVERFGEGYDKTIERIIAEKDFWRKCFPVDQAATPGYWEWISTLEFAVECPGSAPYIHAGISDLGLIKIAIDEGIDVETALTLNTSGKIVVDSGWH